MRLHRLAQMDVKSTYCEESDNESLGMGAISILIRHEHHVSVAERLDNGHHLWT
jgi:hypothetical protein